jgi:hypothetical protein
VIILLLFIAMSSLIKNVISGQLTLIEI